MTRSNRKSDQEADALDDFLWLLVRPRLWNRLGRTDPAWSQFISDALDAGDIGEIDARTAVIGGVTVWIGNAPYGDGHAYPGPYVMPSRRVAERMRREIQARFVAQRIPEGYRR